MDTPLVSVFLVTYNSSNYVLEALESVKDQTYPNIELIISDDASKDNTIEICREWLEKNKHNFKNTILITSEINTGVAPNCNRAIKVSKGEWFKVLAGDDKFLPYSIEEYVKYIKENPKVDIVFAKLAFYGDNPLYVEKIKRDYETGYYPKIKLDQQKQYMENLKGLFLPGPGLFFNRKIYDEIKGYDEKYPMSEEYPFTSYVLEKGNHIKFLDKELYCYNVRENSLGRGTNYLLLQDKINFLKDYIGPRLKKAGYSNLYRRKLSLLERQTITKDTGIIKKFKLNFNYLVYGGKLKKIIKNFLNKNTNR